MPRGTTSVCSFYFVLMSSLNTSLLWTITQSRQERKGQITLSSSHLSLFYSSCPLFIFLSDFIDISINLLPHSITSHHCMLLPLYPSLQSHPSLIVPSIHLSITYFCSSPFLLSVVFGVHVNLSFFFWYILLWKMKAGWWIQVNWWPLTKFTQSSWTFLSARL